MGWVVIMHNFEQSLEFGQIKQQKPGQFMTADQNSALQLMRVHAPDKEEVKNFMFHMLTHDYSSKAFGGLYIKSPLDLKDALSGSWHIGETSSEFADIAGKPNILGKDYTLSREELLEVILKYLSTPDQSLGENKMELLELKKTYFKLVW